LLTTIRTTCADSCNHAFGTKENTLNKTALMLVTRGYCDSAKAKPITPVGLTNMCNRKPMAKLIAGLFLVFVCSTALAQQPESRMDRHSKTLKIDVEAFGKPAPTRDLGPIPIVFQ